MLAVGAVAVLFFLFILTMFGISLLVHLWPIVLVTLLVVALTRARKRK